MRRELNKENTKNLLVASAMELFQIQEYQKTTIDEIAKKAGVSKPTFFAYFKSKEEVLYEFDIKQLENFRQFMKEQLRNHDELLVNLRNSIVHMATNLHTTYMFTQNLMHLVTISEEYKSLLKNEFAMMQSITEEIIHYAQLNEMITSDIPAEAIARDLNNIYVGSLVNWVISNGTESLESIMRNTIDHYISGIVTVK